MVTKSRQEILEEYKGIRRIVINTKYGGFGLSPEAVERYLELCGQPVWIDHNTKFSALSGPLYWLVPDDGNRVNYNIESNEWAEMDQNERQAHSVLCNQQLFKDRDVPRDDPYLAKVVDELGSKANGKYADLKVVNVPADVEWEIAEYDGNEWVAEKHRIWK